MSRNTIILLVVLGAAAVAAFFFFKDSKKQARPSSDKRIAATRNRSVSSFSTSATRTVAEPTLPTPPALPPAPTQNIRPSPPSGISVRDGVNLAATAGCTALTSAAAAPLCGLAAPLAVSALEEAGGKVLDFIGF